MIETIGSYVYVIASALIVIAFIELLVPRSAATGLTRVVTGLCIIALVLDLVLSLFSIGLQFDIGDGTAELLLATWDEQHLAAGQALAEETLSAIKQADEAGYSSGPANPKPGVNVSVRVSASVRPVKVPAIQRVKVGESDG